MNARQIEGWAIEEEVRTKTGALAWGFFESQGLAEQEASRFGLRAVPATLILPPLGSPSCVKGQVGATTPPLPSSEGEMREALEKIAMLCAETKPQKRNARIWAIARAALSKGKEG